MGETEFRQAKVVSVDPGRGLVVTDEGEMGYDLLAVCLGSHPAYFGIEGLREHSLILGSYEQAMGIRSRVLELFREARATGAPVRIVIGGGGFSGVELAGELLDWLPHLYGENGVPPPGKLLTVVEAFPSVLPGWEEGLSVEAGRYLEDRGAELVLNDPVTRVWEDRLETGSGLVLEHDLFIWTGGVEHDPACGLGFEVNGRRIAVDGFCRAAGHMEVYVAGDAACAVDSGGEPQPPTAHIAVAQGRVVARNVLAQVRGGRLEEYRFERAGEIVTLGGSYAVGVLFGFKFRGTLARLLKRLVHYWYVATVGGLRLLLRG
jgi:NADH dehydrogenase